MTSEQWQAMAQTMWNTHLRTQVEAITEHIHIDAKGDTTQKDLIRHTSVSDTKGRDTLTAQADKKVTQTTTADTVVMQDRKTRSEHTEKPSGSHIFSFLPGLIVMIVLVWAFLALRKTLEN